MHASICYVNIVAYTQRMRSQKSKTDFCCCCCCCSSRLHDQQRNLPCKRNENWFQTESHFTYWMKRKARSNQQEKSKDRNVTELGKRITRSKPCRWRERENIYEKHDEKRRRIALNTHTQWIRCATNRFSLLEVFRSLLLLLLSLFSSYVFCGLFGATSIACVFFPVIFSPSVILWQFYKKSV